MNRVLEIALEVAAAPVRWLNRYRRRDEAVSGVDNVPLAGGPASLLGRSGASSLAALRDPGADEDERVSRDRKLADELREYLSDVADQHGATDAMLWMRTSAGAEFRPAAWNHAGAPPFRPWGTKAHCEMVAWAAEEAVVCFDATGPHAVLAACKVILDEVVGLGAAARAGGALVLFSPDGIRSSCDDLRVWLPRHAGRAAQFVDLDLTRNEVARQNFRLRALIRDAHRLQASGDQETLERDITESALDASGAGFGALVRWDYERQQGTVCYVTPNYPEPVPPIGAVVESDSLVAAVCFDGERKLWEDARNIAGREVLFSRALPAPHAGSLAILAVRRGPPTIGAMVLGTAAPGGVRPNDLRTTKMLMQLAASALEAAWKIELVSKRSMTDPLTGLWNRRHYDEQLARVLQETDRFGNEAALLITDIDFFKKVNDSYGHQAGDAVLKMVAAAMKELVRTTDVCARIGGEEMCVILPQTDLGGAMELAERLRAKIEAAVVTYKASEIHVTASLGVSTYSAGGNAADKARLFQDADRALYKAKADGRNCVRTQSSTLVTG